MEDSRVMRRQFLEIAAGASMLGGVPSGARADVKGQVPRRRLGHTGRKGFRDRPGRISPRPAGVAGGREYSHRARGD